MKKNNSLAYALKKQALPKPTKYCLFQTCTCNFYQFYSVPKQNMDSSTFKIQKLLRASDYWIECSRVNEKL